MVNTNLETISPWKDRFHFENEWLLNADLSEVIKSSWRYGDGSLLHKLKGAQMIFMIREKSKRVTLVGGWLGCTSK